jgi:hypothetical protein
MSKPVSAGLSEDYAKGATLSHRFNRKLELTLQDTSDE